MPEATVDNTASALAILLRNGGRRSFLDRAAEALAVGLGARWAGIAQMRGDSQAETLALWGNGKPGDKWIYDLAGTPCGEVVKDGDYCVYPERVAELFPDDTMLKDMGAACYHGQVFRDDEGQILGHVFALDDKATTQQPWQEGLVGLISGWVGTEIEKHRSEVALRESQQMLRAVIDASPVMISAKDPDSRYILMNCYQAALYGVEPIEALGKTAAELMGAAYGSYTRDLDRKIIESGEGLVNYEEELNDKTGARRDWLTTKVPLKDEAGRVRNVVTVSLDITERKRAEKELLASGYALQQRVADLEEAKLKLEGQGESLVRLADDLLVARDEARAADRAKSEFLATMSHELRTPLNAIIGFSEVITNESFGPIGSDKYGEYTNHIRESGQHLLRLINDILDLSKIESGTDELNEVEIDIPEIIRSASMLVGQRAEHGGIKLEFELPDQLPALRADERKLKQVLVNLLSNAVKFTDPGGEVKLKAWCRMDSGFVFQITDNGIGIAPEDIPKALSRFGQADGDLDRRYEGTGLGLPLSKALVELHGGSLDLQSEACVGSTVTVRFPAERIVASLDDSGSLDMRERAAS